MKTSSHKCLNRLFIFWLPVQFSNNHQNAETVVSSCLLRRFEKRNNCIYVDPLERASLVHNGGIILLQQYEMCHCITCLTDITAAGVFVCWCFIQYSTVFPALDWLTWLMKTQYNEVLFISATYPHLFNLSLIGLYYTCIDYTYIAKMETFMKIWIFWVTQLYCNLFKCLLNQMKSNDFTHISKCYMTIDLCDRKKKCEFMLCYTFTDHFSISSFSRLDMSPLV